MQDKMAKEAENIGIQHAGGVAPQGAGIPSNENVKKEVEEEVAKVVKNAVGAQQEAQLHHIAQQNHLEMLDSFDDKRQPQPAAKDAVQPNVLQQQEQKRLQQQQQQQQQIPVQPNVQQQPILKVVDNQQGEKVNVMQQQPDRVPQQEVIGGQQQMGQADLLQQQPAGAPQQNPVGVQQQVVGNQQPMPQGAINNYPDTVGVQPFAGLHGVHQEQQNQGRGIGGDVQDTNVNQVIDTQDALNFVHQQGFLPDQPIQQNNVQDQSKQEQNQPVVPLQGQKIQVQQQEHGMKNTGANIQQPIVQQNVGEQVEGQKALKEPHRTNS